MDPREFPPPSKLMLAAELPRALWTIAQAASQQSRLRDAPRGDGRPIMILPGVAMGDASVTALARYLRRLGYAAETWQLGLNRGTRTVGLDADRLIARITAMAEHHGAQVTLIGISLGGIIARLVAHRAPTLVREVITVCSPYAADARATNAWRTYQLLSGESIDSPDVAARLEELRRPLPVPAAAIWTRRDGMVNAAACRSLDEPGLRIFEIGGGHLLSHLRPELWQLLATILSEGSQGRG